MDGFDLIPILSCFAIPGITWFLIKRVTQNSDKDLSELKEKFSELREKLPMTYVLKDDFNLAMKEIKDMLKTIYNILERRNFNKNNE